MFRSAGDEIGFFRSHAAKSYSDKGRKMDLYCFSVHVPSIVYISPTHALYVKTLHKHTKIVN